MDLDDLIVFFCLDSKTIMTLKELLQRVDILVLFFQETPTFLEN